MSVQYILPGLVIFMFWFYLWAKTDPEEDFLPFWIVKLRYVRAQRRPSFKKNSSADYPHVPWNELQHGTRILVSEFTDEGDLLCHKVLNSDKCTPFVLKGYDCTEPFKILDKIYEVRTEGACQVHLEYCRDRLFSNGKSHVGTYINLKNIPIIYAKVA